MRRVRHIRGQVFGRDDLGKVISYGPTRGATLIVGLDRGHADPNRAGVCRVAPRRYDAQQADDAFIRARAAQVGPKAVGATRSSGKGWYQGRPEHSVAYQVVYIPNKVEPTFSAFKKNMDRLAEKVGERLCQDEVLVVSDNGDRRRTRSAVRK